MMPERYRLLAGLIRAELASVARMSERATGLIVRGHALPGEQDAFAAAAALAVHNAYTGIEELMREIARAVDRDEPAGPEWHQHLLRQMATAHPAVRPPVISDDLHRELRGMLGFRHVVRSSYSDELEPARVEQHVGELRAAEPMIRRELLAFADWLEITAGA